MIPCKRAQRMGEQNHSRYFMDNVLKKAVPVLRLLIAEGLHSKLRASNVTSVPPG